MPWFTGIQYIVSDNCKSTTYRGCFGLNGLYGQNDTIREGDFNSKARLMRQGYIREKSIDFSQTVDKVRGTAPDFSLS